MILYDMLSLSIGEPLSMNTFNRDPYCSNSLLKKSSANAVLPTRSYIVPENRVTSTIGQKRGLVLDSPEKEHSGTNTSNGSKSSGFGSCLRRMAKGSKCEDNVDFRHTLKTKHIKRMQKEKQAKSIPDAMEHLPRENGKDDIVKIDVNRYAPSRHSISCDVGDTLSLRKPQRRQPIIAKEEWKQRNRFLLDTLNEKVERSDEQVALWPQEGVSHPEVTQNSIDMSGTSRSSHFDSIDMSGTSRSSHFDSIDMSGTSRSTHFDRHAVKKSATVSMNFVRRDLRRAGSYRRPRAKASVERARRAGTRGEGGGSSDEDYPPSARDGQTHASDAVTGWSSVGLDPLQVSLGHLREQQSLEASRVSSLPGMKSLAVRSSSPVPPPPVVASASRASKVTQIKGLSREMLDMSVSNPPLCHEHQMATNMLVVKKTGANKVRCNTETPIPTAKLCSLPQLLLTWIGSGLLCVFISA